MDHRLQLKLLYRLRDRMEGIVRPEQDVEDRFDALFDWSLSRTPLERIRYASLLAHNILSVEYIDRLAPGEPQ